MDKVWDFLREILPEFKLPEESVPEPKASLQDTKKDIKNSETKNDTIPIVKQPEKPEKAEKTGKGRHLYKVHLIF